MDAEINIIHTHHRKIRKQSTGGGGEQRKKRKTCTNTLASTDNQQYLLLPSCSLFRVYFSLHVMVILYIQFPIGISFDLTLALSI